MSFKDKEWNVRYTKMGDEAEAVFRVDRDNARLPYVESGQRRPPFRVGRLPDVERYRPDFIEVPRKGDGDPRYVEVQGVGRDGVVKLKEDKLKALLFWNETMPVVLFLWNNVDRTVIEAELRAVGALAVAAKLEGRVGCFDGLHPYYELDWSALAATWPPRAPRTDRPVAPRGAGATGRARATRVVVSGSRRSGGRAAVQAASSGGNDLLGTAVAAPGGPPPGDQRPSGTVPSDVGQGEPGPSLGGNG